VSHEVVVQLIGATTTRAGLMVNAKLNKKQYPTNVTVSAEEMASVNLEPHALHGEWKYAVRLGHQNMKSKIRTCYCLIGHKAVLPGLILPQFMPFPLFSQTFTPDWLTPLNQPVSLPA
jgi:hypothetical protein